MTTRQYRPRIAAALTAALLGATGMLAAGVLPAAAEPAQPRVNSEPAVEGRYFSAPPAVPGVTPPSPVREEPDPEEPGPVPAPTKGQVTGRVVGPDGSPLAGVLVQGVRYSDLGPGINYYDEEPVIARTDEYGAFRLGQLTERYLVRLCDAFEDDVQCTTDAEVKRFAPTYVGPDGVTDSWLPQSRLFAPKLPVRALGTVAVKPSAVLTGTFDGGAYRSVRLLRRNGTTADRAFTDEVGRYRFEVAPGRYRVEADREEGLRTPSTVPGFRSRLLRLTAATPTTLDFTTRPAAIVRGLVTADGVPVPDQFIAITDTRGRFAAGVVSDGDGRFAVESLKPGTYRLSTSVLFSPYVPLARTVTLTTDEPTRADLELSPACAVTFSALDPTGKGSVDVELRDASGRMAKMYFGRHRRRAGRPSRVLRPGSRSLPTGRAALGGLLLRRRADRIPLGGTRSSMITGDETVAFGQITLDRPTVNLTGHIPADAQVKFTTIPADAFLRPSFVDGANASVLTVNWTEQADRQGHYLARGVVPGRYAVAVTTQYRSPQQGPSSYEGNVAVTHHTVKISGSAPTADFSAPRGGIVTGKMRYAVNHRPLIAPVGYDVADRGADSWLFPTVSGPQTYRGGFRVDRLHAGPGEGRPARPAGAAGVLREQLDRRAADPAGVGPPVRARHTVLAGRPAALLPDHLRQGHRPRLGERVGAALSIGVVARPAPRGGIGGAGGACDDRRVERTSP